MTRAERSRAWRAANPGYNAQACKRWRCENPEKYNESRRRYYAKRKARLAAQKARA